jgi:predicted MFS family arabinose efflux permease
MVSAGWVTGPEGGLLGAFNLAGYLVGVLGARPAARRIGTAPALDLGMVLAVLGFAACAADLGLAWLASWRFVSGVSGGMLMGLAGPAVQGAVEAGRRGMAGGIVIAGVASGIVTTSVFVPTALGFGVSATWLALAFIVGLVWLLVRRHWPNTPIPPVPVGPPARSGILQAAYGLSGGGLVPHMVYFVDLAVRGRGYPASFGSLAWCVFGFGGLAGTLLAGRIADRVSAVPALRAWYAIQVAALSAALWDHPLALLLSAFAGGFSTLGLSVLALARTRELAAAQGGAIWVRATAAFALSQAAAGFALAAIFARTGSHLHVFLAGLALSVAALLVSFINADRPAPESRGST